MTTSRCGWTVDRLSWAAALENSSDITGLGSDITGLGGAGDLISPRPASPSQTPGTPFQVSWWPCCGVGGLRATVTTLRLRHPHHYYYYCF